MPVPELIATLEQIEGVRFAVMDAAHFDDLQGELAAADLPFVPLFLDERDSNVRAAGPHLVPLKDREAAMRVAAIAGSKPAVAWWVWPNEGEKTQANLVRHLRGINMAEIPVDRYDAGPETGDDGGVAAALKAAEAEAKAHEGHDHDHPPFVPPVRYELVIFRHADPSVMAMLLPLLDSEQVSRLFGRGAGLVLDAPDQGGLRAYPRPEALPEMPNGWLRIRPEQYAGLGDARFGQLRNRTFAYLKRVGGKRLGSRTDFQLLCDTDTWLRSGFMHGLTCEKSLWQWSYMQLYTDGRLNDVPGLSQFLSDAPGQSDEKIELIMTSSIARLRELG